MGGSVTSWGHPRLIMLSDSTGRSYYIRAVHDLRLPSCLAITSKCAMITNENKTAGAKRWRNNRDIVRSASFPGPSV